MAISPGGNALGMHSNGHSADDGLILQVAKGKAERLGVSQDGVGRANKVFQQRQSQALQQLLDAASAGCCQEYVDAR